MFSFLFGSSTPAAPTTTSAPPASNKNEQDSPSSSPTMEKPTPGFIEKQKKSLFGTPENDPLDDEWEQLFATSIPKPAPGIIAKAASLKNLPLGKAPPKFTATKETQLADEKQVAPELAASSTPPTAPPVSKRIAAPQDTNLIAALLQRRQKIQHGVETAEASVTNAPAPVKIKYTPPKYAPSLETVLAIKAGLKKRPAPLIIEQGTAPLITVEQYLEGVTAAKAETVINQKPAAPVFNQAEIKTPPDSPLYTQLAGGEFDASPESRSPHSAIDQEPTPSPSTPRGLRRHFERADHHFTELKAEFEELQISNEGNESENRFAKLEQYRMPVLDYAKITDLKYIQKMAMDIATTFHNYFNYALPRIRTLTAMLFCDDDSLADRYAQAQKKGVEFAEQMRRSAFASIQLLERANDLLYPQNQIQSAVQVSFRSMAASLQEAHIQLELLHETMQQIQYQPLNTEDGSSRPLLSLSPH